LFFDVFHVKPTKDAQRDSWWSSSFAIQPLRAAAPGSRRAVVAAGARVPAALLAAACGPGRPGLLLCRQGGLACLASSRARGQEAGRFGLQSGKNGF